jgi:hypothetical protein
MTARKVLLFTVPVLAFVILLDVAYPGCLRPGSAVNWGPEDPAIRDVEAVGGVCYRYSRWREYYGDVKGDPIVEVELGCGGVTIRPDPESGRPFQGERVTNAALAKFYLLTELQRLSLRDTVVTDEGLKALAPLRHLRRLDLIQSRVTDAGLKHLTTFEELFELGLASTAVTNEGMKDVVKLRSLTQLHLDHTKVGDAGVAELTALPQLYTLSLDGTRVTDAGVRHLANLHHLKWLTLNESTVTVRAAEDLKKVLPECRVTLGSTEVR